MSAPITSFSSTTVGFVFGGASSGSPNGGLLVTLKMSQSAYSISLERVTHLSEKSRVSCDQVPPVRPRKGIAWSSTLAPVRQVKGRRSAPQDVRGRTWNG